MENFVYRNPTTIHFGKKMEEEVGEIVSQYSQNILLHHYGEEIMQMIGIHDTVRDSLKAAGVKFTELGGVVANPRVSLVRQGIEICRSRGALKQQWWQWNQRADKFWQWLAPTNSEQEVSIGRWMPNDNQEVLSNPWYTPPRWPLENTPLLPS